MTIICSDCGKEITDNTDLYTVSYRETFGDYAIKTYHEKCYNKKVIVKEINHVNSCKYCGSATSSCDENVLCDDCQEQFGHTFYTDL